MTTPEFLSEWLSRMPYHQIAELTIWMDAQKDVKRAIEDAIGESLHDDEITVANPFDTIEWGTI